MRVLISFVRRFFNLILFLGLEVLCGLLIAHTNTLQGNALMNSANLGVAYWYKKQAGVADYFALRTVNDSLQNENMRLREALARYTESDTLRDSAVVRRELVPDSVRMIQFAHYTYYRARVVNNSVNAASNFITLNRGRDEGIRENMAVVSGNGIVGRITDVSAHFSVALSILNTKQRLSTRLKDGTGSFIYWEQESGPDEMRMKITQAEIKVKKGDTVFTTGYSTIFPPDMPVGTVDKIFLVKKDNSRLLFIKPATNFRNMQYVYIIRNDFLEERRRLEDTAQIKEEKQQQKK